MWSRWGCAGGVISSLKQGVCAVVNISHDYGGMLCPLNPPLLGLRDIAVECAGRKREMIPLSFVFNEIKRGVSSSPEDSSSSSSSGNGVTTDKVSEKEDSMSFSEAKKLMKLVNVESLKTKLETEGKEVIPFSELLQVCESMGVARTPEEASVYARVLDEAGVILLFRDKVYLHPRKVADLVRRAVPWALTSGDDSTSEELKKLQEKKLEIDILAHKQVRRILWCGLGASLLQVGLFFRLTFWEFSWDVMEPIAFFITSTGLVIGYAYFLFTSRDPTYQDFMKRLFISRRKKLIKRYNFDVERFKELQKRSSTSVDSSTILMKRMGIELDLDDS